MVLKDYAFLATNVVLPLSQATLYFLMERYSEFQSWHSEYFAGCAAAIIGCGEFCSWLNGNRGKLFHGATQISFYSMLRPMSHQIWAIRLD